MQNDGDRHEMAPRPLLTAPVGLGTGMRPQLFPFQCSANGARRGELSVPVWATAMQSDGLGQETPNKPLGSAPGRLGVFWTFQLLPFQDSARLTGVLKLFAAVPAAMQNDGRGQETAENPLAEARGRLGVGWMDHVVPFHRSASVTLRPELLASAPNAAHAEDEVHDTAFRRLTCAPEGLGVRWIRQVVPFHRSAKVTSIPELFP